MLYILLHYKNLCNLPLAFRHVYGHCTRGEQLDTCKWPRVLMYAWLTVGHVYINIRDKILEIYFF